MIVNVEALLEKWFSKKVSIKRIERHCKCLDMSKSNGVTMDNIKEFRVACVQRQVRPVGSIEQYIDMVYGIVRQAVQEKCHLVIFPEYNFFDLFGLIPGFKLVNRYLNKQAKQERTHQKAAHDNSGNSFIPAAFKGIAHPVENGIKEIVSLIAEGFGVYIYTGSYILKENGVLYNAGSLFAPDGKCLGTQKKTHLTDSEEGMKMGRGFEIKGCSLLDIKVVFPVCMDATYFETFRIARETGADIVILPIANMEEYSKWRSLRGIWPRVQEAYVYGLKASLNGWIAGMHFTGKAGIFAPLEMTPDKNGVIALSSHYEGDYLVTGNINVKRLYNARENAQYNGDRNPEFERQYVSTTYNRGDGNEK